LPEPLRQAGGAAGAALLAAMAPKLTIVERPSEADVEREKAWLTSGADSPRRLALVVVHENAVVPAAGTPELGSFDLFVPPKQDGRVEQAVQQTIRDAIVGARLRARGLERETVDRLTLVPRVASVTVSNGGERQTSGALTFLLPLVFMMLLITSVMGSGQGLLTTTIEEKSSRVIEVVLSAVSPLELMAGKLLGYMAVSLLGFSLYLAIGLLGLSSFSLLGLLDFSLIVYLMILYLIAFFTMGSLMMAAGAAVNELREAQQLMMPIMLMMILPWVLWMPISRDPNSTFATVISMVPPLNTFKMVLRLASTSPPPAWQVWLSIAIGIAGVVAAVWFAAKVFRIGLLMFGKPPNLATLLRWVRAA
jgi:ABC-2 type transport system permease protein